MGIWTRSVVLALLAALAGSAGEAAMTTSGLRERSLAYGQMLATCAGCHREASVRFGD